MSQMAVPILLYVKQPPLDPTMGVNGDVATVSTLEALVLSILSWAMCTLAPSPLFDEFHPGHSFSHSHRAHTACTARRVQ